MSRPAVAALLLAFLLSCKDESVTVPPDSGLADSGQPDSEVDSGVVPPKKIDCTDCTIFLGGTIFDGTSFGATAVVIRSDRVASVETGPVEVLSGSVVDLSGKTLMPGLFDLHVHMGPSAAGNTLFLDDPITPHLKAMLRRGVTSFLDLGTSAATIFEVRSRVNSGKLLGPHVFAAGPLLTPPGGHPCYAGQPPFGGCILIADPTQVTRLDPLFAEVPDIIKIVIESGSMTRPLPQISDASILAIREAADAHGVAAIAHVSEAADMALALDQGVTRFAHVPLRDDISMELAMRMKAMNVAVVPTLAVMDGPVRLFEQRFDELDDPNITDDVPSEVIDAIRSQVFQDQVTAPEYGAFWQPALEHARNNVRVLKEAGVKIVAGTDVGNVGTFHGRAVLRELELYVEEGFTTAEALKSATRDAADFLGKSDLGRLEANARADLLIVDGDASADITALKNTNAVYLAGKEVDRTQLIVSSTTTLELQPVRELAEGEKCFSPAECSAATYCGYQGVCAPRCSVRNGGCATGSACFGITFVGDQGFCYLGDGCDPLAQNCENSEACIWLGNGGSLCYFAGTSTAGQACNNGNCAPGNQCDLANVCRELCDPNMPACPDLTSCTDVSAEAGLPIGECR